jgi:hypothetical protein
VTPQKALARTTALINEQFFESRADPDGIAEGLMASTVALVSDDRNSTSRAGQAALISAFQMIARMGMTIELIAPDVPLSAGAPGVRGDTLVGALLDLGRDLIAGASVREDHRETDVTFAFGDSPTGIPGALRIAASDLSARISPAGVDAPQIACECPLGGLAAGAAAAAIALQAAMPRIEAATGQGRTTRALPSAGPPVHIDLAQLFGNLTANRVDLGAVDVISAGAVTNALLNCLLWLPGSADISVLDDDTVDWDNLNRCMQFRASDVEDPKVEALAAAATDAVTIAPHIGRFLEPGPDNPPAALAPRVAVGVDDIRARWWVQRSWPEYLYIAATSLYEATCTTHRPGGPCAGCAHPHAAPPPQEIPTISFVSFWGGLLQVSAMLADAAEPRPGRRITVFPFALGEPTWFLAHPLPHGAECAMSCTASRESGAVGAEPG